jgi:hypothetical protein
MSPELSRRSAFLSLVCLCSMGSSLAQAVSDPLMELGGQSSLRAGAGCERDPQSGKIRLLGADYGALVDDEGLVIVPFLGQRVEHSQHLGLAVRSVERGGNSFWSGSAAGSWQAEGLLVERELGMGVAERLEAREEGVELSYLLEHRPAGFGDLVVRLGVDSSLGAPQLESAERLEFLTGSPGLGSGVFVGAVTGIAADGERCAGWLDYQDGELVFGLPDDFVERAAYPLLLDPLVGPVLGLSSEGMFFNNDDFRPDLAFDADSAQILVAWERQVSASETRVFARRFSEAGVATSNTVQLSSLPVIAGSAGRPAVANISGSNRWSVVWQEQEESLTPGLLISSIRIAFLPTNFTVAPTYTTIHSVFGAAQVDPDVGAVHSLANLFGAGFGLVVWRDEELGRLALRSFTIVGTDTFTYGTTTTLVSDSALVGDLHLSDHQPQCR